MAHALAPTGRAHPGRRARRLRPAGGRELERRGGLEGAALPDAGTVARRRRQRVPPYMHYNVGGNTKFWGSVLYRLRREDFQAMSARRGRVAGVADRLRDARAVLRSRRAAVSGCAARSATIPPSRRAGRIRSRRCRTRPGWRDWRGAARAGTAPVAAAARLAEPRRAGRLPPVQHLQLVRLPDPREERCGRDRGAARDRSTRTSRSGPGAFARRLFTGCPRAARSRRSSSSGTATIERVFASTVIVSCGAVNSAALLLRSASATHPDGLANSSGLVGRRYMAHLATMLRGRALAEERRRVPEDAGDQRFLPAPARPRRIRSANPVAGTNAPDHGQGDRRHLELQGHRDALDSAVGVRRVGVARDRLAGDDRGPAGSGQSRPRRAGRPHRARVPARTTRGAHAQLVEQLRTILRRLGYWSPKVFAHYAGARNTTHQCGTLVFGTDPRASVLDPFCRAHDVENLFVVDASFFPSSAAVNPGLTIAAQALRVADHIIGQRPRAQGQGL